MDATMEAAVIRKLSRRFVWFLTLIFFACVLDRVNIGFAALSMNKDLGLTAQTFGIGAGLFSVGYLLFEVPSNLILYRVGARRWIARIMITWGFVSMAMAMAEGPVSFYSLRFLLGLAEAGFFPGMMLYLSYWFPSAYRARFNAWFLLAIPLSQTIASAISGPLMELDGVLGLAGWRWLIIVESLPAILLGIVTFFYLTDRPKDAAWLNAAERAWLEETLSREERTVKKLNTNHLLRNLSNPLVVVLGLVYAGIATVLTGVPLWLPQILRVGGYSYIVTGLLAAMPPLVGAVVMVLWSQHSDRQGERLWHLLSAIFLSAFGWILAVSFIDAPTMLVVSLIIANAGILAATSIFWTLPAAVLAGNSAAVGIAFIGVVGGIGGAIGPMAMGYLLDATHSFSATFIMMALCATASGIVILCAGLRIAARVPIAAPEAGRPQSEGSKLERGSGHLAG
jgi:MFS transporter, ACS family, tartrate transporter